MSELPDEPPLARRRTPRTGRRPRFVLPTEHHDERVGEVIEAFLDGPPVAARRAPRPPRRPALRSVRRPIPLDTRPDWDAALRHEDARMARYARPASVLVVRIDNVRPGSADRVAARVGEILRELARETDRVTRAAADRFHILLPETEEGEADVLAERIRAACHEQVTGPQGAAPEILAVPASPPVGQTLRDALLTALDAVGA
ncbi:MAG TPA: diguanylate cyclase [Candidatus Limnocylindrales bacterium]|nr:diguanylate cyclase [Candidatus Limnocylindrales bacterium]